MTSTVSPPASIVIPTLGRPDYLRVTLASIAPQAAAAGAETLVIDDAGPTPATRALAARFGARYEAHTEHHGLNVARNTGVERSRGELVVFVDDDVRAARGWLQALLEAAGANPGVEVFAGRIRASLEGPAPHSCGRENPPVTTLELGDVDTDTRYGWGANLTIRRTALARVGPFDVSLADGGDEQEWQDRLRAQQPGARVLYVAGAAVDHRRTGDDARLRALARTAYVRGRAARRFDARRGAAPSLARELATLGGCAGHVLRRRCPAGLTMVAHSAGRLREELGQALGGARTSLVAAPGPGAESAPTSPPATPLAAPGEDFLSGQSGTVGGLDGALRNVRDELAGAWELASGRRRRLRLAARREPPRRGVLALSIVRPAHERLAGAARAELLSSRHEVELYTRPPGELGKFENLNALLAEHPAEGHDWLLVLDDDVELPGGFLDRFVFLCERFSLQLAQPAHRLSSHAAWPVTRRVAGSVARETRFVEIGPVTAFAKETFAELLPFPGLRMGWGLDAHWAALAGERGWRCGVVDAVSIRHRAAPAAAGYSREQAVAEARRFLAGRPYLNALESQRVLATHRDF
ncbi:MAG TPA: glycosyltransferase family 2 protein [Solirubrobacteraceae bacterium]|nr:glycosyltransferase family 2 protein [Solirubrobacteraceae bacterium]